MYGTLPYTDGRQFIWHLPYARNGRRLVCFRNRKNALSSAASLKGLSLSDFIVQQADEAAIKTIQLHTSWTLEDRDRDFFVQALLNPPEPSARMKAAVKRYKKRGGK